MRYCEIAILRYCERTAARYISMTPAAGYIPTPAAPRCSPNICGFLLGEEGTHRQKQPQITSFESVETPVVGRVQPVGQEVRP